VDEFTRQEDENNSKYESGTHLAKDYFKNVRENSFFLRNFVVPVQSRNQMRGEFNTYNTLEKEA
jgi:hypothetical protein